MNDSHCHSSLYERLLHLVTARRIGSAYAQRCVCHGPVSVRQSVCLSEMLVLYRNG